MRRIFAIATAVLILAGIGCSRGDDEASEDVPIPQTTRQLPTPPAQGLPDASQLAGMALPAGGLPPGALPPGIDINALAAAQTPPNAAAALALLQSRGDPGMLVLRALAVRARDAAQLIATLDWLGPRGCELLLQQLEARGAAALNTLLDDPQLSAKVVRVREKVRARVRAGLRRRFG
jgi:hypothetical protein